MFQKNNMRAQTILAFFHIGWNLVKGSWCLEGLTCLTHLSKEWQTSFSIIFFHSRNSFVPSASFIRQKDSAFKTYETDLPNHVNLCQLLPFFWRKIPSPSLSAETWENQNHATIGRSSTISLLRVTFSPGNKESTCHLHMVHFSWLDIPNGSNLEGYPWSWYLTSLIFGGNYSVPGCFAAVQKMFIIWTENEHATAAKRWFCSCGMWKCIIVVSENYLFFYSVIIFHCHHHHHHHHGHHGSSSSSWWTLVIIIIMLNIII